MEKSQILVDLVSRYSHAPSIAFCRVPEIFYLSSIDIEGKKVLDHCCGDGVFCEYAFKGKKVFAGIDIDSDSINQARNKNVYEHLFNCDASESLPFEDNSFDLVINNSGLEHIPNLQKTLQEIYRVTKKNGELHFCVLGANYFRFWPLSQTAQEEYCKIQPFYHAYSQSIWKDKLENVGFHLEKVQYYLNKNESSYLGKLDYIFSSFSLSKRLSILALYNLMLNKIDKKKAERFWLKRFDQCSFETDSLREDNSSGLYIICKK